jgi:cytochrome o ubiquinol oxidase subunit IV
MNEKQTTVSIEMHDESHISLTKYIAGFVGSIALTMGAYIIVSQGLYENHVLMGVLALLAVVQFILQMVLFLHVGTERKPRWKLAVMCMMLGVVLILVAGSIWIMNNLNYRMDETHIEQYMHEQDSL